MPVPGTAPQPHVKIGTCWCGYKNGRFAAKAAADAQERRERGDYSKVRQPR